MRFRCIYQKVPVLPRARELVVVLGNSVDWAISELCANASNVLYRFRMTDSTLSWEVVSMMALFESELASARLLDAAVKRIRIFGEMATLALRDNGSAKMFLKKDKDMTEEKYFNAGVVKQDLKLK